MSDMFTFKRFILMLLLGTFAMTASAQKFNLGKKPAPVEDPKPTVVDKTKDNILKWFFGLGAAKQKKVYFAPLLSGNQYDGVNLGFSMHNSPLTAKRFEFALDPMLATATKTVVGTAEMRYYLFQPDNAAHQGSFGFTMKSFSDFRRKTSESILLDSSAVNSFRINKTNNETYSTRYVRIAPYLQIHSVDAENQTELELKAQSYLFWEQNAAFGVASIDTVNFNPLDRDTITTITSYQGTGTTLRNLNRISLRYTQFTENYPFQVIIGVENANYRGATKTENYVKITGEAKMDVTYARKRAVKLRLFVAGFPFHNNYTNGSQPLQLVTTTTSDYNYDATLLARGEQSNILSHQVYNDQDGGFKVPVNAGIQGSDGSSNAFLMSFNAKADLPLRLPVRLPWFRIRPYFDFAMSAYTGPATTGVLVNPLRTYYNGGISIDIANGGFGLFIPVISSGSVRSITGGYWSRIAFTLDINKFNPFELLRRNKRRGQL